VFFQALNTPKLTLPLDVFGTSVFSPPPSPETKIPGYAYEPALEKCSRFMVQVSGACVMGTVS